MIVVRLMGGLGNQLFQYAAARRLAHARRAELRLDLSWYAEPSPVPRRYELSPFRIQEKFIDNDELRDFTGGRWRAMLPYFRRADRRIWRERGFGFDPAVMQAPADAYLVGYWQSEKYFLDIAGLIRDEFSLQAPFSAQNDEIASRMRSTDSVGVHFRRGDYVTHPTSAAVHGARPLEYYQRALDAIGSRVANPHFFVFSDDVAWVRENWRVAAPVEYVEHNGPDRGWLDLTLMSCCRSQIIANSSFSWWAAWLNRHPDKIVVAPRRWFDDPRWDAQTGDLLPTAWLRV
jgi:hypothetical protein